MQAGLSLPPFSNDYEFIESMVEQGAVNVFRRIMAGKVLRGSVVRTGYAIPSLCGGPTPGSEKKITKNEPGNLVFA